MSKNIFLAFIFLLFFLFSCNCNRKNIIKENPAKIKKQINTILNNWHKNVANFNYEAFFNTMDEDAVFIGTDASEYWTKNEFKKFAKPYFNKKKTWDFKPITRNIYFSENKKTVWFDELLNTQMRVCRGSGVLVKKDSVWKIKHYVLSLTIPNDSIKSVIKIKSKSDSLFNINLNKQ